MTVTFQGTLKLGSTGRQVLAVKRALARAGFGSLRGVTRVLGPFAVRNIKKFQAKHGIPQSGWFGPVTFKALLPYFDAYSKALYMPKEKTPREKIVEAAKYFASIEPRVHYTQSGARMDIVRHKRRIPVTGDVYEDCSSFATACYWLAGCPDPNGSFYNGMGWTGTLGVHGRIVTASQAQPGDLVLYGPGHPWEHVAIYIGGGKVISHGSEGGPMELPVDYRRDRGQIRSYI